MKMQLLFLIATFAIAGPAQAQAISGEPFVAVHGKASRETTPDLFPLKVTLSETSTDPSTQARIESLASGILQIADRMKIPPADLSVPNLSIAPDYEYDSDARKQVFLGNTYEREITVRFHSLDALRQFIAALPSDKAMRIDTEEFETTQSSDLRRELLREAVEDARKTAEVLAAGAGRKLGAVHTISNQAFNIRYSEGNVASLGAVSIMGRSAGAPPVVLREGRITLDQDVYIIYALE